MWTQTPATMRGAEDKRCQTFTAAAAVGAAAGVPAAAESKVAAAEAGVAAASTAARMKTKDHIESLLRIPQKQETMRLAWSQRRPM